MNPNNINDDNLDALLRRALTTEADMVNPAGDGLGRIRAGIDEQRHEAWWRRPAVALVAAAVLGLAVAGGSVALNNREPENVVATDPPSGPAPTPTQEPTETPSPTPSPSESPSEAAAPVSVPVYYLGGKGNEDIRLYREFHSVPLVRNDRIRTALTEMFQGQPVDPDYTSLWSKDTKVLGVDKRGDTARIDLSSAATKANVGSGSAELTLQQLVYTVTAADNSVKKVELYVAGKPVPELWGHIAVGTKKFTRAPMVDVQALIWLLEPKHGATVGRTVQIKGYGTAFEATISWDVRTPRGKLVAKGFTQGGANGEFAEFADRVTLKPGTYVMRAFESSAEDGRPLHIDDKRFTVE